jgi:hypothetical protein
MHVIQHPGSFRIIHDATAEPLVQATELGAELLCELSDDAADRAYLFVTLVLWIGRIGSDRRRWRGITARYARTWRFVGAKLLADRNAASRTVGSRR